MNDLCFIVQGPSNHVNIIKEKLEQSSIKIFFSTWNNDKEKYDNLENVILSDYPNNNGVGNINLQMTTTLNGLIEAKRLGYKRAIKFRSDMFPTNPLEFVKLFDNNFLNFFSWHYSKQGSLSGYMVDYIMSGNIDDLIKIWTIEDYNHWVPEVLMTRNILKYLKNNEMSFFLNKLNNENDVYWIKYNCYLSMYKTINNGSHFGEINLSDNNEYNTLFNF